MMHTRGMRSAMWVVITGLAACASTKQPAPASEAAPAPPPPKPADQVAMATPSAAPETRAAGDPDEGGQVAQPPAPAAAVAMADTAGAPAEPSGGGLAGIGGGGHGGGAGAPGGGGIGGGAGGMRAPDHSAPRVAPGTPKASNAGLAPEIIRRIVRRSMGRFRYCYERVLQNDPSYATLMSLKFTISGDGKVTSATATLSQKNDALEACAEKAMLTLEFPKPESGSTIDVTYPFNLSPG
jgi:outer membrane biosynthesis protein TonB